jgi:hypothetical protein
LSSGPIPAVYITEKGCWESNSTKTRFKVSCGRVRLPTAETKRPEAINVPRKKGLRKYPSAEIVGIDIKGSFDPLDFWRV